MFEYDLTTVYLWPFILIKAMMQRNNTQKVFCSLASTFLSGEFVNSLELKQK